MTLDLVILSGVRILSQQGTNEEGSQKPVFGSWVSILKLQGDFLKQWLGWDPNSTYISGSKSSNN